MLSSAPSRGTREQVAFLSSEGASGGGASIALVEWATGAPAMTLDGRPGYGGSCGVGAGYELVAPLHAGAMARALLDAAVESGARRLVVMDAECAVYLRSVLRVDDAGGKVSAMSLEVVELMEIVAEALEGEGA